MIRGVVNARHEAIVRIRVRGPGHSGLDVDAVIDSGFTESLTLPAATIEALGLWLLASHELRISVVPGGAVEITPLP